MDWARLIRGTSVMDSAVTPRAASAATVAPSRAGWSCEMSVLPDANRPASSGVGHCTLRIRPAVAYRAAASGTMVAPAAA